MLYEVITSTFKANSNPVFVSSNSLYGLYTIKPRLANFLAISVMAGPETPSRSASNVAETLAPSSLFRVKTFFTKFSTDIV